MSEVDDGGLDIYPIEKNGHPDLPVLLRSAQFDHRIEERKRQKASLFSKSRGYTE